jgi:chemotaxis protein methyltransferase CheR
MMKSSTAQISPEKRAILDDLIAALRLTKRLDITSYDESFVLRSLEKRRMATGCRDLKDYIDLLLKENTEEEAFSYSLHVIYSEFFRNILAFARLEKLILPRLLGEKEKTGKSEIRVWSAGCAAGQEAWSVAILLDGLISAESRPVSYRIFASDQSEADLATARLGVYGVETLQNVRLRHLDSSFVRQGSRFAIAPHIKERVDFSFYDLFDANTTCPPASIFGDFDLVLCRNLLFYYRPEKQHFILEKLQHSMASRGYLMTSKTERLIVEKSGIFQTVSPPVNDFFNILKTR